MAELKYTNEKGAQDKYGDIQPSQTADRMAIIAPNLDLPEEDIEKGDDVVIGMSPYLAASLASLRYDVPQMTLTRSSTTFATNIEEPTHRLCRSRFRYRCRYLCRYR